MAQRTWCITGVNSGFGRVMTELLLKRGDRVAGTSRRLHQLDDLKAQYGEQLWLTPLDLTDTPEIYRAVDSAFSELGHIDVIVVNAGYALIGVAEEFTEEQIFHQFNTNLVGSIQVVRAALPHLRRQGGGRILQMSSVGGQTTVPGLSIYLASKWVIEGFLESAAQEVAPFCIQITLVEPGGGRTSIFDSGRLVHAPTLPDYANTPAKKTGEFLQSGAYMPPGDPTKMMQAAIDSVEVDEAPRRLVLGSDAYSGIHEVLTRRLSALRAQREIALSTDAEA